MRDQERARARWKDHDRRVDAMVKMVVEMIEHQRKSYMSAIAAAANFSSVRSETIEIHLKSFMKKRDRRARLVKDAAVMGMMRAGLTNQEIASRLSVRPNTISNIKAKVLNPSPSST